MIVIRVELWPKGDRTKAEVLGIGTITNIGGSETKGNYVCSFSRRGGKGVLREAAVRDFPRKQLGAWDLLYRALKLAFAARNE